MCVWGGFDSLTYLWPPFGRSYMQQFIYHFSYVLTGCQGNEWLQALHCGCSPSRAQTKTCYRVQLLERLGNNYELTGFCIYASVENDQRKCHSLVSTVLFIHMAYVVLSCVSLLSRHWSLVPLPQNKGCTSLPHQLWPITGKKRMRCFWEY